MINWALYKQGIKSNFKIFLIFIAVLTLYITMIISMFDPKIEDVLAEFYKTMPELMRMVGMSGDSTTLNGFIITYLYGFLFIVIPMVVSIIISNKLISSHVDKGSMTYLLASVNNRQKIILTQIKVIGTFIFALVIYCTTLSIITSEILLPGLLNIPKFLILNLGLLIFHLAISGICFLASCIFNDTKNSLLFGAGIPVVFFLIQMLANMGGKLENMKYLTMFTLFDPIGLSKGTFSSFTMLIILLIISITLYVTSIIIFKKKDFSV